MNEHFFEENSEFCKFCGSMKPGENNSCISKKEKEQIKLEPKLRQVCCEDWDFISNRIKELKLEKDQMINHVDEEGGSNEINKWDGLLA